MTRGKFITIEGIEGAGKSTALQFIQRYFANANIDLLLTREPGGTEIAEEIRKVLLYPASSETVAATTELLLMFASRAQHISHCIAPALQANKWVVSDRYVDATYAYQGGGRGLSLQHIKTLDELVVGDLYPELTLLLDVPAELGCARAEKRGTQKDRIEQERVEFFMRVRQAYLERAKQQPHRIKIIDASLPLEAVEAQLRHILDAFLAGEKQ